MNRAFPFWSGANVGFSHIQRMEMFIILLYYKIPEHTPVT